MKSNPCLPPMIQDLLNPKAYPGNIDEPIDLIETHISWVLLAGRYSYKIKKPVNFGFLDFSTLEMRRASCLEELRVNKRYSPDLYIGVTPICGTPPFSRIDGNGDAVEYAVVMSRFPPDQTFDQLASAGTLTTDHILLFAELLARFHLSLPPAPEQSGISALGHADHFVAANFEHLRSQVDAAPQRGELESLAEWTLIERARRGQQLLARSKEGHIRECHGDLHLGNVVLLGDRVRLFDGIEFNADLRWIDTLNEVAFPLMDLEVQGYPDLAYRFLNRYLELSGDYGGMCVLDYYRLYRAMVRAKVASLRREQTSDHNERAACGRQLQRYVDYGLRLIQPKQPKLIIMHGLSGSGKSVLASDLAAQLPGILIRSDIERKRYRPSKFAVEDEPPTNLYHPDQIRATYERLFTKARCILQCGHTVILDATFLRHEWREHALRIAIECHAEFRIVDCQAPVELLQDRIQARRKDARDPSDADMTVLERQMVESEPLTGDERSYAISVDTALEDPDRRVLRTLAIT